jgi:hypothetical protein
LPTGTGFSDDQRSASQSVGKFHEADYLGVHVFRCKHPEVVIKLTGMAWNLRNPLKA